MDPIAQLSGQLEATLSADADTRKKAEAALHKVESTPQFSVMLLKLAATETVAMPIRKAGAIFFKNFIKTHWVVRDDEGRPILIRPAGDTKDTKDTKTPATAATAIASSSSSAAAAAGSAAGLGIISLADRALIKQHIVNLMLSPNISSSAALQSTIAEALSIIAKADFHKLWPNLLPELVEKLKTNDFRIITGVLETIQSIVARYRYELKSDALWGEIQYILTVFDKAFLEVFQRTLAALTKSQSDPTLAAQLPVLLKVMVLISKIFHSLISQELADFFDENLKAFLTPLKAFLTYTNKALDSKDDSPGVVEQLKTSICDTLTLFVNKYEDDFKEYAPLYVTTVWTLLTTLGSSASCDDLATSGIRFLTAVVSKEAHKPLFANETAMKQICERVIIPQLKLRESDLDSFNNDGKEYLQRDTEGSDVDTRRRTTVDFIRGLCVHFEPQISALLKGYIAILLKDYAANREKNFIHKDAALFIVLALTVKGSTRATGVTKTNQYVDVGQFYTTQILPELQEKDVTKVPVLKADCLKFVSTFRHQIPKEAYGALLPHIIHLLSSQDYVVHTYAAIAIDRLFTVKDAGVARFDKTSLKPIMQQLLVSLFAVLEMEESKENEYVMKAITRVCNTAQDTILPFVEVIIKKITAVLMYVSKNPRQPNFNHMLFETLSCLVSNICSTAPTTVDAFEKALFPPFQQILNMETCVEFGPYVFQILSLMLEYRVGAVSAAYTALFPMVLTPALYQNAGNVPPLARLIQVYIMKAPALVASKLMPVLGVFQSLVTNKKYDQFGMSILNFMIEFMKLETFGPYLHTILGLLYKRLSATKTTKFVSMFAVFVSMFVSYHGLPALAAAADKVKPGSLAEAISGVVLPAAASLSGSERKVCAIGFTNLICKQPAYLAAPYIQLWTKTLEAIIATIELPEVDVKEDEEADALDAAAKSGYNSAYSRLLYASNKTVTDHDPFASVASAKSYLTASLKALMAQHPGKFQPLMAALAAPLQAKLQSYPPA